MTKVSTITPSYKSEKYLKGFLKNVKQQTHNNLEIILDHKEPTENEINIVKKFNSKNNNIKHLISDKVYPIGPYMNKCIENSTGEYLCIWNVDDLRTPNSIEVMAKALDEKKDVDIVIVDEPNGRSVSIPSGLYGCHSSIYPFAEPVRNKVIDSTFEPKQIS